MKKIFALAIVAVLAIAASNCKGSPKDAKGVAQAYSDAMGSKDFDAAKKYATAETGKMLDLVKGMATMMPETKVTVDSCEETGDTAVCQTTNDKGEKKPLNLKKVDGDWKVHQPKEKKK